MAETNFSRLNIMIILTVFITSVYMVEGIVISAQETLDEIDNTGNVIVVDENGYPVYGNYSYENVGESDIDVVGSILGLGGFLTFEPLGLPMFMQFILSTTMLIISIVIAYIIYSFARDWVPFV